MEESHNAVRSAGALPESALTAPAEPARARPRENRDMRTRTWKPLGPHAVDAHRKSNRSHVGISFN